MPFKRNDDDASRKYWECLRSNAMEIATWPEWKRGESKAEQIEKRLKGTQTVVAVGQKQGSR